MGAASPVLVQMWERRAQSRCRCGSGEPSPGADVTRVSSLPARACSCCLAVVGTVFISIFAPGSSEHLDLDQIEVRPLPRSDLPSHTHKHKHRRAHARTRTHGAPACNHAARPLGSADGLFVCANRTGLSSSPRCPQFIRSDKHKARRFPMPSAAFGRRPLGVGALLPSGGRCVRRGT